MGPSGGGSGDCSTGQQQTVTVGDGPVAAAAPGEHFENYTTAVCCFFGVGAAERLVGAQGCVIPRQTGVGGWAVAGLFFLSPSHRRTLNMSQPAK